MHNKILDSLFKSYNNHFDDRFLLFFVHTYNSGLHIIVLMGWRCLVWDAVMSSYDWAFSMRKWCQSLAISFTTKAKCRNQKKHIWPDQTLASLLVYIKNWIIPLNNCSFSAFCLYNLSLGLAIQIKQLSLKYVRNVQLRITSIFVVHQ